MRSPRWAGSCGAATTASGADLAQPVDLRGRHGRRVPGGARPAREPEPGGHPAPDHRRSGRRSRAGRARPPDRLRRRGARDLHRQDDGSWTARAGDAHVRWGGAPNAEPQKHGGHGTTLELMLDLPAGSHHDLVLVLDADGDAPLPDIEHAWQGTAAAWAERVPELEGNDRPPRRAPRLRRAGGIDDRRRRDGRGGDDFAARAGRPGPELRLSLRVDPRPVLRRAGGGPRRAAWS